MWLPTPEVRRSMRLWSALSEFAAAGGRAFGGLIDRIATVFVGDCEERRRYAFSVAMVGLSAKMAKADGVVTRDEVSAFSRLVIIGPDDAGHVSRLFNIARQDVAGFQSYARKIASLYPPGDPAMEDIVDGLFTIATADGLVHTAEIAYLGEVSRIFGMSEAIFERIRARHVIPEEGDPYLVIGADRSMTSEALRKTYLRLVRENHPDRLIGHGVPEEFVAIATHRLAAINRAWEHIARERRL
jgi:DnaJ like chaperone protein